MDVLFQGDTARLAEPISGRHRQRRRPIRVALQQTLATSEAAFWANFCPIELEQDYSSKKWPKARSEMSKNEQEGNGPTDFRAQCNGYENFE